MNRSTWPLALLLVLLVLAVYAPLWDADFIWDDNLWLWSNPITTAPDGLVRAFTSFDQFDYYPLTSAAFWIEWRVFERDPRGYHVVNVLLHALAALLLWRVLLRLGVPGAWVAAAIFAVHPVAVATVAWITEIKNTLSLVFFLAALLAWLRFEEREGAAAYAVSLGMFVFALLAKASAVVFPVVVLTLAWWRRGRVTRHDVVRTLPFLALAVGLGIVTLSLQAERFGAVEIVRETLPAQIAIAARAVWFYLGKALLPLGLTIVYPLWETPTGALAWVPVLGLALGVAVIAGLAMRGRRGPAAALIIWLAALAPTLGFVPLYYTLYSRVADHWAYLGLPALIALVVGGVATGLGRSETGRRLAAVAAAIVIVAFGLLSFRQATLYRDAETVWRHVLAHVPESWIAHHELAVQLGWRGDLEESEEHFVAAIELRPGYALAHSNLARLYQRSNRRELAKEQYQRAIEARPDFVTARMRLAMILLQEERPEEALPHLDESIALAPQLVDAHLNRAVALAKMNDLQGANESLDTVIELDPDHVGGHVMLAKILYQLGELESAIFELERVLQLDPDHEEAVKILAAMKRIRDGGGP